MTISSEINATYYAIRLISHRIDISQMEEAGVNGSDEFTPEERIRALRLIEDIQKREGTLIRNLSDVKINAYVSLLADTVDELANFELDQAGFDISQGDQILETLRRNILVETRTLGLEKEDEAGGTAHFHDPAPVQDKIDLRRLFWSVARMLHPDHALDEGEARRRHRIMAEASRAYRDGDVETLSTLLDEEQRQSYRDSSLREDEPITVKQESAPNQDSPTRTYTAGSHSLTVTNYDSIKPTQPTSRGLKLVAIGGGTGLSTVLSGLKELVGDNARGGLWLESLSAIVTVSDDGGSSGRLREELQMPPPGDIRNCMVALSEDSKLLSRLFRYRFRGEGGLGGHSFGNLFLAALTEVTGDFMEAVRLSSEVLASKGRIYPATLNDVQLVAELEDGTVVRGQTNIAAQHSPVSLLRLEPERCLPMPEALAALRSANIITVGPGSLYTSILPNLLVENIAKSVAASRAIKIFICNLMTQPGETDDFTVRRHLEAIKLYAPEIEFDFIIVNNRPVTEWQAASYASKGSRQIGLTDHALEDDFGTEAEILRADLLDDGENVRHSPEKLVRMITTCYELATRRTRSILSAT